MNETILVIIAAILFTIGGCALGFDTGIKYIQQDAIENGVGQHVITDKITGETQFQWITNR